MKSSAGYCSHFHPPLPTGRTLHRITLRSMEGSDRIKHFSTLVEFPVGSKPVPVLTDGLEYVRWETPWVIIAGVLPRAHLSMELCVVGDVIPRSALPLLHQLVVLFLYEQLAKCPTIVVYRLFKADIDSDVKMGFAVCVEVYFVQMFYP